MSACTRRTRTEDQSRHLIAGDGVQSRHSFSIRGRMRKSRRFPCTKNEEKLYILATHFASNVCLVNSSERRSHIAGGSKL